MKPEPAATARHASARARVRETRLLELLLPGKMSVTQAAREMHISRRAAYRIYESPTFQAALNSSCDEVVSKARRRANGLADKAADKMVYALEHPDEPGSKVIVSAYREVFNSVFRGHEIDELERQQEALRAEVDELKATFKRGRGGIPRESHLPDVIDAFFAHKDQQAGDAQNNDKGEVQ